MYGSASVLILILVLQKVRLTMSVGEQRVLDSTGQRRGDLQLETGLMLSLNI